MASVTPDKEISTPGVINIDRTSPVPLYFQLAQHYEAAIRSGALKVGSRLDNEVQLAERLGMSRPTGRAAFLYLSNQGQGGRQSGRGAGPARPRRLGGQRSARPAVSRSPAPPPISRPPAGPRPRK